jgi:septum formation protein
MTRIVLASGSRTRAALLAAAGIAFEAKAAAIDERAIEAPLRAAGKSAAEIALALAEAKGLAVAGVVDLLPTSALQGEVRGGASRPTLVIGADQTLECEGRRFSKPGSREEARAQIAALAGRTHALHAGLAGVRDGAVAWRHVETARLTMRVLTSAEIDAYLNRAGEAALESVGAYQIEGLGIQLFERIEGDYFTILGLPLLPLLKWLRGEGVAG